MRVTSAISGRRAPARAPWAVQTRGGLDAAAARSQRLPSALRDEHRGSQPITVVVFVVARHPVGLARMAGVMQRRPIVADQRRVLTSGLRRRRCVCAQRGGEAWQVEARVVIEAPRGVRGGARATPPGQCAQPGGDPFGGTQVLLHEQAIALL